MIWLLLAVPALLFGVSALLAYRLPDIDQVYADYPSLTPELVRDFGIGSTAAGLALVVLGIAVHMAGSPAVHMAGNKKRS